MPVIRLILLLGVLGGLTLLLWQNWSPVLPLVFLGVKTQALPLAIWILFSLTAGVFTSLIITALFNVSNYFVRAARSPRPSVKATPTRAHPQPKPPQTPVTPTPPKQQNTDPPSSTIDDWSSDASFNDDDWHLEAKTNPERNSNSNTVRDTNIQDSGYQINQPPSSGSQSGSVYSYSYRQPSNSGVGKTEAIYDANYRVIRPPYQEKEPTPDDDDDWGFEDDELEENTK